MHHNNNNDDDDSHHKSPNSFRTLSHKDNVRITREEFDDAFAWITKRCHNGRVTERHIKEQMFTIFSPTPKWTRKEFALLASDPDLTGEKLWNQLPVKGTCEAFDTVAEAFAGGYDDDLDGYVDIKMMNKMWRKLDEEAPKSTVFASSKKKSEAMSSSSSGRAGGSRRNHGSSDNDSKKGANGSNNNHDNNQIPKIHLAGPASMALVSNEKDKNIVDIVNSFPDENQDQQQPKISSSDGENNNNSVEAGEGSNPAAGGSGDQQQQQQQQQQNESSTIKKNPEEEDPFRKAIKMYLQIADLDCDGQVNLSDFREYCKKKRAPL